jgi:hypothetical protein
MVTMTPARRQPGRQDEAGYPETARQGEPFDPSFHDDEDDSKMVEVERAREWLLGDHV